MFLVAILTVGGWYFSKNPGKFNEFLAAIKQSQNGAAQNAPGGYYPQNQPFPAYPSQAYPQQPAAPMQTNYNGQPVMPVAVPAAVPPAPVAGGQTIRIASFNIQVFGEAKAQKKYVMGTLASIIQNFQVVAIQEIRTQDDYFIDNFLRTYVNTNGRTYNKVIGPRLGRTVSKEQYAFLYDAAAVEVNPRSIFTVNDPDDLLHREPLVAMFRVRGPPPQQAFTFVLVDIHTDPDETKSELNALGQVYQAVRRACGGEDDIIVLGDLNVDDQHLGDLGRLDGVRPVIRGTYTNTRQNAQYDNIIFHAPSTTEFTGRCGVFNFAQQFHLTVDQALQVSDHFPIWAEFNAYESTTPGRVASRDGDVRTQ
jgi:endonuclease/exonuclease/phosphatase family metal-dependent hydrolase